MRLVDIARGKQELRAFSFDNFSPAFGSDYLKLKKMKLPELIKAGDERVLLGIFREPPKVDCRVWAEDNYQSIVKLIIDIRDANIGMYLNGESPLLPEQLRIRINDFIKSNKTNQK